MTDRYMEGYRDGAADTRERFLASHAKEVDRLRELLREAADTDWPWPEDLCRRIDAERIGIRYFTEAKST